ncbi:MAG: DM13 domain-containing protein [Actinomycetota bacterium]
MDISGAIRRHPGRAAALAAVGLAAFVFGMWWFTPWRLFTDDPVNEALPATRDAPVSEMEAEAGEIPPPRPSFSTVAEGEFISLEHETRGSAIVLETTDGKRFLRFEGFETSNGPDLLVYLSSKTPSGTDDWHGYDADFIDLGPLKGNVGNQNYEIPPDVDLAEYSTAVVWCRRFEVGFAAATLA